MPNLASTLAMGAAIELLLATGIEHIEAHNRRVCAHLAQGLLARGYTLVTSQREGESAGLLCASKPGVDSEAIQTRLAEAHVLTAVRGGNLRFAPHLYNTLEEVERLLQALP